MTFADIWWQLLLLAIGAYLIGNINWSIIISCRHHKDVRTVGSGNPGTMNMLRNMGAGWGALTLFLDITKGLIPALVGKLVFGMLYPNIQGFNAGDLAQYIAGFAAVVGHVYPALLKFKGGKGVATTFGVFFASEPVIMAIALVVCISFICLTEYGSLGSFIGIAAPAIVGGIDLSTKYFSLGELIAPLNAYLATCLLIFAIVFLTFFAHRKNIKQLMAGTEHKTPLISIISKFFKKKDKNKGEAA